MGYSLRQRQASAEHTRKDGDENGQAERRNRGNGAPLPGEEATPPDLRLLRLGRYQ